MRVIPCTALLLCLLPGLLAAQGAVPDRYQRLEQMHHTAFTARDGLVGVPRVIAQTTDGFLWIGTSNGLLRYDGAAFERYRPEAGELPAVAVSTLAPSPDGGLWVGHSRGGVTFISREGRATHYGMEEGLPIGKVRSVAVDHDGGVWLAAVGGLARLEGDRWKIVREDWNYPNKSAWTLFVERDGTLWVGGATPDNIRFLPRGSRSFIDTGVNTAAIAFVQLEDSVVAWAHLIDPTVHVLRRQAESATELQVIRDIPSQGIAMDREGGLWVAGYDVTRMRVAHTDQGRYSLGPVERVTVKEGLTAPISIDAFIDREGTTWVTTEGGVDRFRRRNLTWVQDTLVGSGASFITDRDGAVWLMAFRGPSLRRANDMVPIPGSPVVADNGFPDRFGNLWFGTTPGFAKWDGKRFTAIPPPAEVTRTKGRFMVLAGASDTSGQVWASVGGYGVFTLKDSTWTFREILKGRPDWSPVAMQADAANRVWLAYRDELAMVLGDSIRIFSKEDGLDVGALLAVRSSGDQMWAGGERGLAWFDGERFRVVPVAGGGDMGSISGIAPSAGGLWLASTIGIVHIPAAEIERVIADRAYRVHFDLLGAESDLPEQLMVANMSRAFQPTAAGADGIIWFATMNGIARVDPRMIAKNPLAPPVAIRSVIADDSAYSTRNLTLPPLTRTLRIGYAGLSFVNPAQVQYRYRLDGWEKAWHEAGSRREVSYTDLKPGKYTFRVTASNNDGVWNEAGAAMPFTVEPAWYQTAAFKALFAAALLALVIAGYQYHLRRVSAMLAARFDARLEERTRIARDLHDTLLQTVQGSRMVADDALERVSDAEHMRHTIERLSKWLAQAAQEGRAALNSLRGTAPSAGDLAASLRNAAGSAAPPGLSVSVKVSGVPRDLHPVARDEIYRIGYEAIRNACLHARATNLAILLEYGNDLCLRVTDDGAGIGAAIAASGKEGHYGLRGMRERAASIGATLTIAAASPGTQVNLVVPGHTVFQGNSAARAAGL